MNSDINLHMVSPLSAGSLKWSVGFLVTILVQVTVLRYIAIEVQPNISVQPDLILLLLFFMGLRTPQITATVAGFLSGILYDILAGGIIGLSAFTKTIVGFLTGFFPPEHKIQKIVRFSFLLFFVTMLHDMIFNAIFVINTEFAFWRLVVIRSIPSSIYTVFVGSIIFYGRER